MDYKIVRYQNDSIERTVINACVGSYQDGDDHFTRKRPMPSANEPSERRLFGAELYSQKWAAFGADKYCAPRKFGMEAYMRKDYA